MTSEGRGLSLDERIRAEDELRSELFHTRDRGLLVQALLLALALHVAVLFIRLPDFKSALLPRPPERPRLDVRSYLPPSPQAQPQPDARRQPVPSSPTPEPLPAEPQPLAAAEPPPPPRELSPPTAPLLAGVGKVSNPVLILDTRVQPKYPEMARAWRIEGSVTLQAVIGTGGSVERLEVLQCDRQNLGFEEAALAAVRQWRYEPAIQNGQPVAVYSTVFVEFKLDSSRAD